MAPFLITSLLFLGCVGDMFAPTLLNTSLVHILERMSTVGCGLSIGTVRITSFDFVDDAVAFAKPPKFLRKHSNRREWKESRLDCESPV